MITISTINLALENQLSDPESDFNTVLFYIDLAFSVLFFVEISMKIISRGLIFNGKYSYLRNPWSVFDFCVILLSLLSYISTDDLKASKILRNFRVVRPLRLISKNTGLKMALQSLVNSMKGIINITIIVTFMFFVWGIFGVNFFKGLYYYCYKDHINNNKLFSTALSLVNTKWDCINTGGEWISQQNTFDNVLTAAFSLFQISTTEGWYNLMLTVVDATDIDYMPITNNN